MARWSHQRIAKLRRLWATGMHKRLIADELNTSVGQVYRMARLTGLHVAKPPAAQPRREMPAHTAAPGWPTKQQLMAGR